MAEMTVSDRGRRWARWWEMNSRRVDAVAGLAIIAILLLAFVRIITGPRPLDIEYMYSRLWPLAAAAQLSIFSTVVSFAMGLPIGFIVGWARTLRLMPFAKLRARFADTREQTTPAQRPRLLLYVAASFLGAGARRVLRGLATGYVEVMRGTPLFLQILFAWYVFTVYYPRIENLALLAGILAMTANTGGYQGEIFRAGLQTVHTGQLEAARAIGLTRLGAMRHVVLPQALRLVIPPLTNEFIGLFKASALLFFIGVEELTFQFKQFANFESRIFELFVLVTFLYLGFTIPLAKAVEYVEKKYRIPGLGIQAPRGPARRPPARRPSAV